MQYDIAVIIGRFQPIHKGHIHAFRKAEQIAHKTVCVIGSINRPSTPQNPFSFLTRKTLILEALVEEDIIDKPIEIVGVQDSFYREQEWYRNVRAKVEPFIKEALEEKQKRLFVEINELEYTLQEMLEDYDDYTLDLNLSLHGHDTKEAKTIFTYRKLLYEYNNVKVAVLGYDKDDSSYYLHNFSDWNFESVITDDEIVNASDIRVLWYSNKLSYCKSNLHEFTFEYMQNFNVEDLREDWKFIQNYDPTEFPIQMLTTDAVVIHGDEVLLIRRGIAPGKGLWALPGGFIEHTETFFNACIRELREETRIDVPEKVIRGSLKDEKMFDFPKRSSRGRTVSMAYLFVLDPTQPRPRVKGGDDAVTAWWFPLAEVKKMRDQLYEDHPDIIEYMTARI